MCRVAGIRELYGGVKSGNRGNRIRQGYDAGKAGPPFLEGLGTFLKAAA
jgi:hypothetical protein